MNGVGRTRGSGIRVVKMPYKDKQKRVEYKKRWNKEYYSIHKQQELERVKKRKQQLRSWFNKYKENFSCSKCREKTPVCLEFHHLDKKRNSFSISESIESGGYSKAKIIAEINKCIVLCANCHRKLHSN